MTTADLILGLMFAIGAATATAFAILAEPAVRQARAARKRH